MAIKDSEITQLLTEAPPSAPTQQDTDTAKTASASDAAQNLVDATSGVAARPLGQPDASGWRRGVDVSKEAANVRPNVPAPGSFADHLSNALLKAREGADAATLSQPGAWSKLMVGSTLDALTNMGSPAKPAAPTVAPSSAWGAATSNADATRPTAAPVAAARRSPIEGILNQLGDVAAAPGPRGVAGGFARAAGAGAQRTREADKDRASLAESNARMLHEQALTHKLGEEQVQSAVTSGKAGLDALLNAEKPATLVVAGKTSDELKTMIDKGELDPTRQTVFLTGRVQTGSDANGQPLFRSTYSVVNPAGEVKLKEDEAKFLNENLHSDWKEGQVFSAVDFNQQWQQAQNHQAADGARRLALAKINEQVDKAKLDSEANNIGNDKQIQAALAAAQSGPNDPHSLVKAFNSLINNKEFMASHPNFTQTYPRWAGGGDAKKFETMQENYAKAQDKAQNAVDDMLNKAANDPKEIEGHTPAFTAAMKSIIADPNAPPEKKKKAAEVLSVVQDVRQGEIDLAKAMAEGKKEAAQGFQGDPNATSPEAFLSSLKPEEQSLVKMISSGRAPTVRLEYLVARKPEVLEAVERAFPGQFDASKVKSYVDAYKDFTSGKTATQLNAGGTALLHLKELQELNNNWSHFPGTPSRNAYENKADTVATELAKFYGDATVPAIAAIKKTLMSELPGTREAAIKTQAKSMGDKMDSFQTQWTNAAPSKVYQAPMPHITPKAREARAALDPEYGKRFNPEKPPGATMTYHDPNTGEVKGWAVNGKFVPVPEPVGAQ